MSHRKQTSSARPLRRLHPFLPRFLPPLPLGAPSKLSAVEEAVDPAVSPTSSDCRLASESRLGSPAGRLPLLPAAPCLAPWLRRADFEAGACGSSSCSLRACAAEGAPKKPLQEGAPQRHAIASSPKLWRGRSRKK